MPDEVYRWYYFHDVAHYLCDSSLFFYIDCTVSDMDLHNQSQPINTEIMNVKCMFDHNGFAVWLKHEQNYDDRTVKQYSDALKNAEEAAHRNNIPADFDAENFASFKAALLSTSD
ncbi:MAG: hypothetical protein J6332_08690, partial [Abditibacteriota bacterium]|nr:hypothetical protein [Abditibacteriota bacterium]